MGKSSPKAPTPPDPYQTAAAQTQTNRDTAMTNAAMNRINQVTPWGNLTYSQGANDAQGNPTFTQTVDLSPAQRALMESSDRISQNMANLGEQQLGRVNQAIGQGVDFNAAPQVRNTPLQYGAGSNMPMLTSAGGGDAQTSIGPLGAIQGQVAGAGQIQRGIQNNTLQTNMGQSGQIQSGINGAGAIRNTIADSGQVRGDIAGAGQIQRGIDSSGTQNLTRNVGGGPIQSQIDMSEVTGLVGGDALRDTMTQAQRAAYDMQKSYLDPNYSQRQEAMQNRLINQGITQNSEAWNRAMSQLGRERTFDYNNAFNNSFERGLAAQGQLYNQGLSSRQQTFGEANTRGGFANAAQAQGFGQGMQNAQLNNAAAGQLAQQRLAEQAAANAAQAQQFGQNANETVLSNAAQAQRFGQNERATTLGNEAQAQQYGQNANDATFANNAQQQQFAQQMGRMQAENAARGQEFSQGLQVGQFGNQAQQQQFGQNLAGMEAANAAQQQGYAQQLGQGAFTNAALAQNFDQRSANNAMNNQVSNDMFQRGLANAQLNNQASNQDFNQSTADRARVLNEMQQQQQIPLNLLNALRTGSQVTSPEFGGVPQVNMAGTDLAGMIGQNYQNQMGVYNAKMARNNAITSGLFSLGGAALGGI